MREVVEKILKDKFEYKNGALDFSCSKLEISIKPGENYEGSFEIISTSGTNATGRVTTSDSRMECITPEFSGSNETISFLFNAGHIEAGEVIKGSFTVVSNYGEYYLPFVVTVMHNVLNSSIGTVKNLFHFANLAKSNWKEAVELFYSEEFKQVFSGSDTKLFDCYRALSGIKGNNKNVEEFLININKKQKIEYSASEEEIVITLPLQDNNDQTTVVDIDIVKNGWGYASLDIECDGDFLCIEKTDITDEDFIENKCKLSVAIKHNQCHKGKNYGRILIFNSHTEINIPVLIKKGEGIEKKHGLINSRKNLIEMVSLYESFRLRKINSVIWRKESGDLVEQFVIQDENDIAARLFQAQLLISESRLNEAEWILKHVEDILDTNNELYDVLYAYYLYLTTLINRDEKYVNTINNKVNKLYLSSHQDWRIAWLLLYLSEEYNKSAISKWMFIEKQYYQGCTSPILYIEAIILLCNNPMLLRKAKSFEIQVINYGVKKKMLTAELVEQILEVLDKTKDCNELMIDILISIYQMRNDLVVLQAICTLLIKCNKSEQKYFEWYELGVEHQLRITNLYEYYMMSLDISKPKNLPKILVMYFAYENNLDREHTAYLFDYVQQHKNVFPEIYSQYEPKIDSFVKEQISKLRINRNMASLYQSIVTTDMINENNAENLSRLLFANLITVNDSRLRRVYVYHPGVDEPEVYSIRDKSTWVSLYGTEFTICFEDSYGNRFIDNVECKLEKLMIPGKYIRVLQQYNTCYELFNIYISALEQTEINKENIDRIIRIASNDFVFKSIRYELLIKLIEYLYSEDDYKRLDQCLEMVCFDELTSKQKEIVIKYMVIRSDNDKAFNLITRYGAHYVDSKTLLRLVSQKIKDNNMMYDRKILNTAKLTFQKGKFDDAVLSYLVMWFEGSLKEMRDIFNAAMSFELDCYKLSERMIIQMLFSGAYIGEKMDIFRYYVSNVAKQDVELAFLTVCSYDYFVNDNLTEEFLFDEIRHVYMRNEELKFICKLAYVKYYSENKDALEGEKLEIAHVFVREILKKEYYLNFLREYMNLKDVNDRLIDKSIVEYRTKPGNKCKIHYVRVQENGEACEYIAEYMNEVYGGVCFKAFVLFFGESVQYYITEENGENSELTESGTIEKSDIVSENSTNKHTVINDIMISKTLQDYDTLDISLVEYYKREFLNENLFKLV